MSLYIQTPLIRVGIDIFLTQIVSPAMAIYSSRKHSADKNCDKSRADKSNIIRAVGETPREVNCDERIYAGCCPDEETTDFSAAQYTHRRWTRFHQRSSHHFSTNPHAEDSAVPPRPTDVPGGQSSYQKPDDSEEDGMSHEPLYFALEEHRVVPNARQEISVWRARSITMSNVK